ncbi:hypothetical protein [Dactylosporangium sp. CA-233914]|uniref:hypothetical protein n=1 Tax=Dactylosporangium sp. CA-233914 TaxID=3239934 RepID=UPI003D8FFF0E
MTKPANLTTDEQAKLTATTGRGPILKNLTEHVRTFADMMTNLAGNRLPQWINTVLADDTLPGLRRDLAAVTAGLTLPWNSGAVEGQVNRIKMLQPRTIFHCRTVILLASQSRVAAETAAAAANVSQRPVGAWAGMKTWQGLWFEVGLGRTHRVVVGVDRLCSDCDLLDRESGSRPATSVIKRLACSNAASAVLSNHGMTRDNPTMQRAQSAAQGISGPEPATTGPP